MNLEQPYKSRALKAKTLEQYSKVLSEGGAGEAISDLTDMIEEPNMEQEFPHLETECSEQISGEELSDAKNGQPVRYPFRNYIHPGQELILTGLIGVSGTLFLGTRYREELKQRFSNGFLKDTLEQLSAAEKITTEELSEYAGIPMVIPVGEGGLYRALNRLWELGGRGFTVNVEAVPIKQITIECCEYFDLDPWELYSGGCALVVADRNADIPGQLNAKGVSCRVIGSIIEGKDKMICHQGVESRLNRARPDALLTVLKCELEESEQEKEHSEQKDVECAPVFAEESSGEENNNSPVSEKEVRTEKREEPDPEESEEEFCARVEQDIRKKFHKKLFSPFAKACKAYELIQEGDRIAVCISGGKDSLLMAKLFQEIQRHRQVNFELTFLVMDPGYTESNRQQIEQNARLLGIPVVIFESRIFYAVDKIDDNPCYMCARMRRGNLYNKARELGCNKIALGHHYDDVIETILMGMLYGAQVQTMMPKLHAKNFPGMELIRPMYLVREEDVCAWRDYYHLTFLRCACHFTETCTTVNEDGSSSSKRMEIKHLIRTLKQTNPFVEGNIFKSVENVNLSTVMAYKKNGVKHFFLEDYEHFDIE